jgi:hypothetical protein
MKSKLDLLKKFELNNYSKTLAGANEEASKKTFYKDKDGASRTDFRFLGIDIKIFPYSDNPISE